jgi:hypothetical protein
MQGGQGNMWLEFSLKYIGDHLRGRVLGTEHIWSFAKLIPFKQWFKTEFKTQGDLFNVPHWV